MPLTDNSGSWGLVSRLLHWLMAVLIVGLLALGTYMVNFEDDLVVRFELTQLHKSFGFAVFVLALLRIFWRASAGARPALPDGMPEWERTAARLGHVALYCLMLALPLSGWLLASASPLNDADAFPFRVANTVFGLFELPDPFAPGSKLLTQYFRTLHIVLGLGMAGLVLLHVVAALKHEFLDRDGVLSRMLRG